MEEDTDGFLDKLKTLIFPLNAINHKGSAYQNGAWNDVSQEDGAQGRVVRQQAVQRVRRDRGERRVGRREHGKRPGRGQRVDKARRRNGGQQRGKFRRARHQVHNGRLLDLEAGGGGTQRRRCCTVIVSVFMRMRMVVMMMMAAGTVRQ